MNNIRRNITSILAVPALCLALYGCKPVIPTPAPDAKVTVSGLDGRLGDNKVDAWDSDYAVGNVNINVENGSIDSITWEQGSTTGIGSYNASTQKLTLSGNPAYGMVKVKVYGINDDAVVTSPTTLDGILVGPNGSSGFYSDETKFNADYTGMGAVTEGRTGTVGPDATTYDFTPTDIETMLSSLPFKNYVKGCVEMSYGLSDKTSKYIVFSKNGSGTFNYTVFETDKTTNDDIYSKDPLVGLF